MLIKARRGLNIPIEGAPKGAVQDLPPSELVALEVDLFEDVSFKLMVKVGDVVKRGQPILFDKKHPKRLFVSPAAGRVKEIRRGLKRRLIAVVIERAETEECFEHEPLPVATASREELVERMCGMGLFAHIRMRPFNLLANPEQTPRTIFVKAIESAPFVPPADMQVEGHEDDFAYGLQAIKKLSGGPVHLVHREGSTFRPFTEAVDVEKHTASGPHPVSNVSLHIHKIDPIRTTECVVWTVNAHDVVSIGKMLRTGVCHFERVIGVGGSGTLPDRRGFFRVRTGCSLESLIVDRTVTGEQRFISGDPLMGRKSEVDEFLGFNHFAFSVIPVNRKRKFLHFLRPGFGTYTASKAYISGHLPRRKPFPFTTSMHGEERGFIDGHIYDKYMPLRVPTAPLVKAVIAQDWDQAEQFGLLEVDAEDFALPTFACPSKVEMVSIVKEGLAAFAAEVIH